MLDFVSSNIKKVKDDIITACKRHSIDPATITLCAVSKTKPIEYVNKARECGLSVFGENYVQEVEGKFSPAKRDYKVHLIGHLQSNKVSKVVPLVDSIDSVDSVKLVKKIEQAAAACDKSIDVMLEYNSSHDENKTGFANIDEMRQALDMISASSQLNFTGMMTMGPLGGDGERIRASFLEFMDIYSTLAGEYKDLDFRYKSFGMSSDWELALECGSNFLRIGTAIFGERK